MHKTIQLSNGSPNGKTPKVVPWELSSDWPVSVRAENAWAITHGSSEVTIAIIDDCFDNLQLPLGARYDVVNAVHGLRHLERRGWNHGSQLAEMIVGNRHGYPGVAPECNLLLIKLPSLCSESEEVEAFNLALRANAAVVCCAWGSVTSDSSIENLDGTPIAQSIERLVQESRDGLGAIVFFAVGNTDTNIMNDPYLALAFVTAVGGITAVGNRPSPMSFGEKIAFVAPASSSEGVIGGDHPAPPGASGAAALASGVAGLVFSANPYLKADEVLTILKESANYVPCVNNGLLDAGKAVIQANRGRTMFHQLCCPRSVATPVVNQHHEISRYRERRFIGGEHAYLGYLGAGALQNRYHSLNQDPLATLFGDIFEPYTTTGLNPTFNNWALYLLSEFFRTVPGPTVPAVQFGGGVLPYQYLLGLAGDLYGSPRNLLNDLRNDRSPIPKFVEIFREELITGDEGHPVDLVLPADLGDLIFDDHAHYLSLASKNYSHFAGDNLLFYLSYHLLAVAEAMDCAVADNGESALNHFILAILSEAFAGHFLTDMFSAGHARVPRYAFLHHLYKEDKSTANLISNLLHNHEGRIGVFLTNAVGQVWYSYGDGKLLKHSRIYNLNSASIEPWLHEDEPLDLARYQTAVSQLDQPEARYLEARYLAGSVVFASLADVLRHLATGFPSEESARGRDSGPSGLLGYVLDRVPFALPSDATMTSSLKSALNDRFGSPLVSAMAMRDRLQNIDELYETYKDLSLVVKQRHFLPNITRALFENFLWKDHLTPDRVPTWTQYQVDHLEKYLKIDVNDPAFLEGVPLLVNEFFNFPTTLVEPFDSDDVRDVWVPSDWKVAVPQSLIEALTATEGGVWD